MVVLIDSFCSATRSMPARHVLGQFCLSVCPSHSRFLSIGLNVSLTFVYRLVAQSFHFSHAKHSSGIALKGCQIDVVHKEFKMFDSV